MLPIYNSRTVLKHKVPCVFVSAAQDFPFIFSDVTQILEREGTTDPVSQFIFNDFNKREKQGGGKAFVAHRKLPKRNP